MGVRRGVTRVIHVLPAVACLRMGYGYGLALGVEAVTVL